MAEDPYEPAPQIEATTGGFVWWDANADQVRQRTETPYEGWEIVLANKLSRKISTTKTDISCYYQFWGLKPGT
ncbi:MAG: SdrD B-like domain-containing protein [Actinomycetota bacterium]|nr:SdrD B-like domain-containing protein [Actinomycetota bacterium]